MGKDRLSRRLLLGLIVVAGVALAAWGAVRGWGENGEGEMVYVPASPFLMGEEGKGARMRLGEDPNGDRRKLWDERPRRTLRVEGFFIDRYEVTNAQYQAFVTATRARTPGSWKGEEACPKGKEDYPVTGVNQGEAEAYCQWMGKKLPTEEEWEKAARGERGALYPWGNFYREGRANTWEEGRQGPFSVHDFPADDSPYGVRGMAGNVAEWTSTRVQLWNDEVRDVVKGGSWVLDGREWTLASEILATPYGYLNYVGFRCAKSGGD